MGALLRGKMLAALRALHARGAFAGFSGFDDPEAFDHLMQKLASAKRWIVYAKRPFARVDHVLKYLGRYTHRVGISNSRLADVTAAAVTFRTKNGKTVTITPVEFLRRFVQHVLPDGFHKIRHFGLYAGAAEDARTVAQSLLAPKAKGVIAPTTTWSEQLRDITGRDVHHCRTAVPQSSIALCLPSAALRRWRPPNEPASAPRTNAHALAMASYCLCSRERPRAHPRSRCTDRACRKGRRACRSTTDPADGISPVETPPPPQSELEMPIA